MKKICIVTGSRADYGLLKSLIDDISLSAKFDLQLLVTGAHLSPDFGFTYREIIDDGYSIDWKLEILMSSNSPGGVCKTMGVALLGVNEALEKLKPDLLIILGDRYEMMAIALAATVFCIPLAHIHGGEVTKGSYDNSFRHAITKLSHFHFASTAEYKKRIIQLGENPINVFNVGSLGVQAVNKIKTLNRIELEKELRIKLLSKAVLVTFHSETLDSGNTENQMNELLLALEELKDTTIVFTMPNADNGGGQIKIMIEKFVSNKPSSYLFGSLGQTNYFSMVANVDAVIGNSSSGIIEVPSFKKPTINIGSRQSGRVKCSTVIDVMASRDCILAGLVQSESDEYINILRASSNPYDGGETSTKILKVLEAINFDTLEIAKEFYDL